MKTIHNKTHELMLYNDVIENNVFIALSNLNYFCVGFMSKGEIYFRDKNFFDDKNLHQSSGMDLYKLYILNQKLNNERNRFARKYFSKVHYLDNKKVF